MISKYVDAHGTCTIHLPNLVLMATFPAGAGDLKKAYKGRRKESTGNREGVLSFGPHVSSRWASEGGETPRCYAVFSGHILFGNSDGSKR